MTFDEWQGVSPGRDAELVALDDALSELAKVEPRKSQVVELRRFGGPSVEETAEVLKVSPQTVMRDWNMAKLWLLRALRHGEAQEERGEARELRFGGTSMTDERRQRIESLCLEALAREAGSRLATAR